MKFEYQKLIILNADISVSQNSVNQVYWDDLGVGNCKNAD